MKEARIKELKNALKKLEQKEKRLKCYLPGLRKALNDTLQDVLSGKEDVVLENA